MHVVEKNKNLASLQQSCWRTKKKTNKLLQSNFEVSIQSLVTYLWPLSNQAVRRVPGNGISLQISSTGFVSWLQCRSATGFMFSKAICTQPRPFLTSDPPQSRHHSHPCVTVAAHASSERAQFTFSHFIRTTLLFSLSLLCFFLSSEVN